MSKVFTVVDFPKKGKNYGRYYSDSPKAAAKKAFSKLSRKINLKNSNQRNLLVFTIKNLDSGKKFKYIGTRVELFEPITIKRANKVITYKYKNIIAKYNNNKGWI